MGRKWNPKNQFRVPLVATSHLIGRKDALSSETRTPFRTPPFAKPNCKNAKYSDPKTHGNNKIVYLPKAVKIIALMDSWARPSCAPKAFG